MTAATLILEYRQLAEQCRGLASGTMHAQTRAALHQMADEYLAKADALDARTARLPTPIGPSGKLGR